MSVILTGPSPLVPRPEEEGARTAGAHLQMGRPRLTAACPSSHCRQRRVWARTGVHRVQRPGLGPRSGALPTTVPLSASLPLQRRGHCPSMNVPSAFFQFQLQFRVRLQGTRHIGRHGVGDGEEMTPKGNTNHVEKDLFFKTALFLSEQPGWGVTPSACLSIQGAAPAGSLLAAQQLLSPQPG